MKEYIAREKLKFSDINRQELRLEPKGKALKDDSTLKELDVQNGAMLYFKVKPVFSLSLAYDLKISVVPRIASNLRQTFVAEKSFTNVLSCN